MTEKRKLQILTNFLMVAILPLPMAYNLISETHERLSGRKSWIKALLAERG